MASREVTREDLFRQILTQLMAGTTTIEPLLQQLRTSERHLDPQVQEMRNVRLMLWIIETAARQLATSPLVVELTPAIMSTLIAIQEGNPQEIIKTTTILQTVFQQLEAGLQGRPMSLDGPHATEITSLLQVVLSKIRDVQIHHD